VIINYSEFLADALRDDDKLHDDLREILGAADRAADLTRRLLAFSHHQTVQPEVIDLNVVISEMQKLLSRTIGEHVVLETRLHPELAPIKADPSQVEQILLNLVVNARDAMPDGGTARIETEAVELDATYAETHPYTAPGDYVRLTVSDNGTGMDAEVAEHAFDPFFTTKPTGKGTGLGLATVYGAVRQAGGSIDIYTEPGLGTTFKLYFPLTAEHRVERARDNGAGHGHHKASGTVLVVEDEDAVRKLTVRILHDHGFEVIEAADPQKAFTLLEPHRVDLLLTDVIMPGMSGTKLAEQLVGLRPDLKVVYMSGYTDDFLAHQGILEQGISLVEKPFTAKALISSVCAALAGGHDEAKEE